VLLATAVDALRRKGMFKTHAAVVAWAYCRVLSHLPTDYYDHINADILSTIQEVREKYYEWKPELDKIHFYPDHFVEDIIDLVLLKVPDQIPDKIRKKYSTLFQLHDPDRIRREYPSLFEARS
jgi:hypothetical protein